MFKISKGLDIPIKGKPKQILAAEKLTADTFAVTTSSYNNLRPYMAVEVGQKVAKGEALFWDKLNSAVKYVSPCSGKVIAINRGDKRALISVVVKSDNQNKTTTFDIPKQLSNISRQQVVDLLAASGEWLAFRERPFNTVPPTDYQADAIFVNCMDSNPLAPSPSIAINEHKAHFLKGLRVVCKLTKGKVYINTAPALNLENDLDNELRNAIKVSQFIGPHPAGLTGTHIAQLHPISEKTKLLTINYQDLLAIGALFATGVISTDRIIAIAGPHVKKPQLYRTDWGAQCSTLLDGLLKEGGCRVIAGSILNGVIAEKGNDFLCRSHNQISVLPVSQQRKFLHYLTLGGNRFSSFPIYTSHLNKSKEWDFDTSTNGSDRSMVPIGLFENIMPLDILPTQLLRALITGDTEQAQLLGCLELAEEDLALCTYVCPGKYDYGLALRAVLKKIAAGE